MAEQGLAQPASDGGPRGDGPAGGAAAHRTIRNRFLQTLADIERRRPDVLVTIDSPGYNRHVLKKAARMGVRRVHYVAPQVWAWRERRVRNYPGLWDKLLCLLPFEPAWFARARDLRRDFVGHPVLECGAGSGDAGAVPGAARARRRARADR